MNILILIVILVGAIVGFCQGAFKQIAKFAGIFGGVILASIFSRKVGGYLADTTGASTGIATTVAFVIIVILVPILLGWLASLLTKLFSTVHLGFVNRFCGAVIGAICYVFVLSFAFNLMDFAQSSAGYAQSSLEPRETPFYLVKHLSQPVVPDVLIVDDSTEVAELGDDKLPRCGLKNVVDDTVDKINPFN